MMYLNLKLELKLQYDEECLSEKKLIAIELEMEFINTLLDGTDNLLFHKNQVNENPIVVSIDEEHVDVPSIP